MVVLFDLCDWGVQFVAHCLVRSVCLSVVKSGEDHDGHDLMSHSVVSVCISVF